MYKVSREYKNELNLAYEEIKKDIYLLPLQKEILTIILISEKGGYHSTREFEESLDYYNKIALKLYNEFNICGVKNYSKFKWFFYKNTYQYDMELIANLILSNWFSRIKADSNMEEFSYQENNEIIEEIYILKKTFLDNENNYENYKDLLNLISTPWLTQNQLIEVIKLFFNKLGKEKRVILSKNDTIYRKKNIWFQKIIYKKHVWKNTYERYLKENEEKNNSV